MSTISLRKPNARELADSAVAQARVRADLEEWDLNHGEAWADFDAHREFVRQLRSFRAWSRGARSVVASVAVPKGDFVHSSIVCELLDHAGQDLPDSGLITAAVDGRTALLSW